MSTVGLEPGPRDQESHAVPAEPAGVPPERFSGLLDNRKKI